MYADTHCHLNHEQFDADREAVLSRASAQGVTRLLCVGYDTQSSLRALSLAQETPEVYAAIGLHPDAVGEWSDALSEQFSLLCQSHTDIVKAWGEIGLDYHWETHTRSAQQSVFAAQIEAARSVDINLPLVIHCREALEDTLAVLRESGTSAPVIMHCFTGSLDEARLILNQGYYLGIGGVATFKKSDTLREMIAHIPLERLLLETDCPYLAPQPWRGRRNEPSYLPAVVQTVADCKAISVETVGEVTSRTARALFRWA